MGIAISVADCLKFLYTGTCSFDDCLLYNVGKETFYVDCKELERI